MEGTFTSLLNEGTYSESEDMVFTQPPPQSQSLTEQQVLEQNKNGQEVKEFFN